MTEKVESLEQAATKFMERSGVGRQTISTTIGREWSVTHLMAAFAAERERQVWAEAWRTAEKAFLANISLEAGPVLMRLMNELRARGEQVK